MTTNTAPDLEESITELAQELIYPLWGKDHTPRVKAQLDYHIRFDKKLRDLAVLFAKTLSVKESEDALIRIRSRMFNRVCALSVINKQEQPDNRICASCFEEKTRGEFMNFDPNPKRLNVCETCQRKYAEAIQSLIGLPN